jgi:hypothetical protein
MPDYRILVQQKDNNGDYKTIADENSFIGAIWDGVNPKFICKNADEVKVLTTAASLLVSTRLFKQFYDEAKVGDR